MKKNMLTKGMEMAKSIVKDITEYDAAVKEASSAFWKKHPTYKKIATVATVAVVVANTVLSLDEAGAFKGIKEKVKEKKIPNTFEACEVVHSNDYRLTKYAKAYLKSSRDVAITTFAQPVKCHHAGDEYYKLMTYDNCYDFNKHTVVGIVVKMVEKTDAYALVEIGYFDPDNSSCVRESEVVLLIPQNNNTTTGSINK